MPGFAVHLGATVLCAHAGQAMPVAPSPRVLVGGQPVVAMTSPYTIAGCALTGTAPPCVTGQWIVAATRVLVGGAPLVLQDSTSICTPTGTPMLVVVTQVRVRGT
jgi:hypothetical protein